MHRFLTILFASSCSVFMRFVCGSNRLTITGQDAFQRYAGQGGNIFAFWHNRLFYLAHFYVRSTCARKATMLVSLSRDGDYGAALVRKLGQEVVRGSSSRGGPAAVRKLARKIAEGRNVAITPDGPRGPAFVVHEGIIKLAQVTGARIIPASFDASRRRQLRSWDRFIILKPFGRVHVAIGEPIEIPRKITPSDREQYRKQLEQRLHELDQICRKRIASDRGWKSGASEGSLVRGVH